MYNNRRKKVIIGKVIQYLLKVKLLYYKKDYEAEKRRKLKSYLSLSIPPSLSHTTHSLSNSLLHLFLETRKLPLVYMYVCVSLSLWI